MRSSASGRRTAGMAILVAALVTSTVPLATRAAAAAPGALSDVSTLM